MHRPGLMHGARLTIAAAWQSKDALGEQGVPVDRLHDLSHRHL